jgi:hypothetical protein
MDRRKKMKHILFPNSFFRTACRFRDKRIQSNAPEMLLLYAYISKLVNFNSGFQTRLSFPTRLRNVLEGPPRLPSQAIIPLDL